MEKIGNKNSMLEINPDTSFNTVSVNELKVAVTRKDHLFKKHLFIRKH